MKKSRREFLTLSGAGLLATSFPGVSAMASPLFADLSKFGFDLGIASYTFRKFSLEDTLKMTERLGITRIGFKSFHLPLDASDDLIASTVAKCNEAGINLYGAGVVYMKTKEEVDNAFEYAKKAKMKMIIGVPNHELLSYTEGKVKKYGIKLAIHNHGPGDDLYPSAESAYKLIKGMDAGMGLCIDIGHTKRINRDPEQDLVDYFDRVFDIHIKDVTAANKDGSTCEVGRGVIDIPAFLNTVVKKKYAATLAFEYEKDADDPFPGLCESVGYVRGVLATMGA
jgi:sugar phosphate isomerase/epimerase